MGNIPDRISAKAKHVMFCYVDGCEGVLDLYFGKIEFFRRARDECTLTYFLSTEESY